MSKTISAIVMLLMIVPGLVGAIAPIGFSNAPILVERPTVQFSEPADMPMAWNGSENGKYDALTYDLSVALDPVIGNLTGTAKATIKALKAVPSFSLTLVGTYKVSSVKDGLGNALVFKHNASLQTLTINLTTPATAGQTFDVIVNYNGQVNRSLRDDNCDWKNGGLLQRETPWYPMPLFSYDSDEVRSRDLDRHNVTVHVLVPGNWSVVSVGTNLSMVVQGPFKNFTYRSVSPIGGTTVAAGNFSMNTTTYSGVTLRTYLFKPNATRSGRFMDKAKSVLDFYTTRFGAYPYNELRMVEVTDSLNGFRSDQEMVITDTFGNNVVPVDLAVGIADQSLFFATNPIGNYDAWLTRSMSEYLATYYQLAIDGKSDRLKSHHNLYGGGTGELPIKDIPTTHNKFTPVIYHKGTYIFHMLRYLEGNATFDGIIQNYLALAHGKNCTLDDFMLGVRQETSTNLTSFFESWLNTTQFLDYSVTSMPVIMYQDGSQLKVEFTVTKIGAAAMPGDIGLMYDSGSPTTLLSKAICKTCSSKTFGENITEDVSYVVFDPDLWLLDVEKDNDKVTPMKDDLLVVSFSVSPSTDITEGDTISLSATVKNAGQNSQGFVLSFYANDTLITSKSTTTLAAGANTVVQASWESVKGMWDLKTFVDSDEVLKEYNETNNKKNETIDVAEYIPPPDLYFIGELTMSKKKVTEGEYVLINATVFNNYKRGLSGIYVDLLVDSKLITTVTLGLMLSNSSTNASANWLTTGGSHVLKAILHAPPGVIESNTNNNEVEAQVSINSIPEAKIDVDKDNPFSGQEVEFSGLGSTDDGSIVSYKFDFGDGQERNWSISPTARHTYKYPSDYMATVQVRDNSGVESPISDPITIEVKDVQPTADFDVSPAEEGYVYTVFTFIPDAKDPDGNITTYYWDFGDEYTTDEMTPTHKYNESGTYTVRLAVTDNSGQSSTPVTKTITIKNLKPNALGMVTPSEVFTDEAVTLDASASWDPDGPKNDLTYKWSGNAKFLSSKAKDTNVKFNTPGEVTITLTVTDAHGAENKTNFDITVKARPNTGGDDDPPENNNTLYYAAAAAGVGIAVVFILGFLFMRSKKAKVAEGAKASPKPKVKATKPGSTPTKPTPKTEDKTEAKAPEDAKEEAPKPPVKKEPIKAPMPTPKPAAPKPKAVKKPASKPTEAPAEKPAPKPPEKKASVHEKAKKAAEDEWES